ncbi:ATP-binding protein [Candidatus Micrarchaeota archaeon]|jgi:hypothetical protein|nr:ATP-binding protein [Candidatus Micrarchaeota archaeon]
MPSAKDVTIDTEFLKVMSVGESGTGKSIFASTFPTPGFIFDFGKEILSYRGLDFDYEQYELSSLGWGRYEQDFNKIKQATKEGLYKTVVVDNLSAMEDVCMEKALQIDPKRSQTNGPIWNVHYQMVKNLMEGKLRQLINLPCNLVLIAHLDFEKNENGQVIGVGPSLTGKLSIDVPSYFDEVYYHTYRKEAGGETKWYVQTVPLGHNHGRSRLSGKGRILPDLIENDYAEVMAYITGKKVKTKKPLLQQNK